MPPRAAETSLLKAMPIEVGFDTRKECQIVMIGRLVEVIICYGVNKAKCIHKVYIYIYMYVKLYQIIVYTCRCI